MAKRVLDVGQCRPDHAAIRGMIERQFGAEVLAADDLGGTLALLRAGNIDLVLVNRQLDADSSDGLEIIRQIKADPQLAAVPVLLVSNYPESQETAVQAGAEPGFGKAQLQQPATLQRLRKFLE